MADWKSLSIFLTFCSNSFAKEEDLSKGISKHRTWTVYRVEKQAAMKIPYLASDAEIGPASANHRQVV